jgi:hypothetical protein
MNPAINHVFPTLHKDKHSKLVAFPLGAEKLSRLLEGVPQHANLTCSFYAGNPHRDRIGLKGIISVLQVMYRQQSKSLYHSKESSERGAFDPKWSIIVFSVPQEFRHEIKIALIESELERTVRPWLLEQFVFHGRPGECILYLRYDSTHKVFLSSMQGMVLADQA